MSAKTFTDRQGQYLAFIDAYTRVHAGPRPRAICSTARGQPAVCAPDGAYAGAPRARPPPAGRGAQHRGAPRPRGPACPTPPRTGQILCAGELVPYDRREAMTRREAAKHAGRSEGTVRMWCLQHDIGRRVAGGPWAVSRVALAMLL